MKNSEWTLIKTLDYNPLLFSFITLKANILETVETLQGKNYSIYHPFYASRTHNNQLLILNQYLKKAELLINQLFPETYTIRTKRELIDG